MPVARHSGRLQNGSSFDLVGLIFIHIYISSFFFHLLLGHLVGVRDIFEGLVDPGSIGLSNWTVPALGWPAKQAFPVTIGLLRAYFLGELTGSGN